MSKILNFLKCFFDEVEKLLENRTLAQSFCVVIIFFVISATLVSLMYYGICNLTGTPKTGSDLANIFVASATLLGPFILVLTFNAWKVQHNKNIDKEITLVCWDAITLNVKLLDDVIVLKNKLSKINDQLSEDYLILSTQIEDKNEVYVTASYNAIVQALKVKALCLQSVDVGAFVASINEVNKQLTDLKKISFDLNKHEDVKDILTTASNSLLTEIEGLVKAK